MTKKDYEKIAAALENRRYMHASKSAATVDAIAMDLCKVFGDDNPRFNAVKFLQACGCSAAFISENTAQLAYRRVGGAR